MSIDKSLKRKRGLARQRSVYTREERIKFLQTEEKWKEGQSPFNLPKVRVTKLIIKKAKKAKTEEGDAATPATGDAKGAAKPAAGAKAAAPAKDAAKKK